MNQHKPTINELLIHEVSTKYCNFTIELINKLNNMVELIKHELR